MKRRKCSFVRQVIAIASVQTWQLCACAASHYNNRELRNRSHGSEHLNTHPSDGALLVVCSV